MCLIWQCAVVPLQLAVPDPRNGARRGQDAVFLTRHSRSEAAIHPGKIRDSKPLHGHVTVGACMLSLMCSEMHVAVCNQCSCMHASCFYPHCILSCAPC